MVTFHQADLIHVKKEKEEKEEKEEAAPGAQRKTPPVTRQPTCLSQTSDIFQKAEDLRRRDLMISFHI